MSNLFSWGGLDKALSQRAQLLSIAAAALANLLFINRHIKDLLADFLPETQHYPKCKYLIDSTDTKLLEVYLSVFLLGLAAIIIRYFTPREIKEFDNRALFLESRAADELSDVYRHYEKNIANKFNLNRSTRRTIEELIDSTKQLVGMTATDIKNFARSYHSYFFDLKNTSYFFAPAAKISICLSAILFGYQAVKTFLSVVCVETAAYLPTILVNQ